MQTVNTTSPVRRLRHAMVASDNPDLFADRLRDLFGLDTAWEYTAHGMFMRGLRVGGTFIETITPTVDSKATDASNSAGGFLGRHGPGLHFLVAELTRPRDVVAVELLRKLVQLTGAWEDEQYNLVWTHPKSTEGVLWELGEVTVDGNPWTGGAGPGRDDWFTRPPTGALREIVRAVIVTPDAERSARRYRSLFGMTATHREDTGSILSVIVPFPDGSNALEFRQPLDSTTPEAAFAAQRGKALYSIVAEADDVLGLRDKIGDAASERSVATDLPGFLIDPAALHGVRMEIVGPSRD